MVDPVSATVGVAVLVEGVKFLYTQAGELLRHRRQQADEPDAASAGPTLAAPPGLVEGTLEPAAPNRATLDRLADDLQEIRRTFTDYVEGIEVVDPADPEWRFRVAVLREMIEAIYGRRITFTGEDREPSGPLAEGRISVDQVLGDAAVLRARVVRGGRIRADADVGTVGPEGRLTAIEIDELG